MLVISMSTTTAVVRYVFIARLVSFQYRYNQLAVSSLPISRVPAMIAIGNAAALKMAIRPAMLNQAATPAMPIAVRNVSIPNHIHIFITILW
jgi:hypothetical protein